jgi:hypothetical protein
LIGPPEHKLDGLSTSPILNGNVEGGGGGRLPKLGSDVWIGARAIVLKGVGIGHGAVVAAGAVVSRDVGPYRIVAGVPAREVRPRFAPEVLEELVRLQWWEWPLEDLPRLRAVKLEGATSADQLKALRLLRERESS